MILQTANISNNFFLIVFTVSLFLLITTFLILVFFLRTFKSIISNEPDKQEKEVKLVTQAPTPLRKQKAVQLAVPLIAIFLVLVVSSAGFLLVRYFGLDVKVIPASQIKLEQNDRITLLQREEPSSWKYAKIMLLDIRDRDQYAKKHLFRSTSLPAQQVKKELIPTPNVIFVIYAKEGDLGKAQTAAREITNIARDKKIKNIGKIYVVKDGFEGMVNSGFKTEGGVWD